MEGNRREERREGERYRFESTLFGKELHKRKERQRDDGWMEGRKVRDKGVEQETETRGMKREKRMDERQITI